MFYFNRADIHLQTSHTPFPNSDIKPLIRRLRARAGKLRSSCRIWIVVGRCPLTNLRLVVG